MIRTSMARGILILDENLLSLLDGLRDRNFRVLVPRRGLADENIKYELLPGRILITNNTKDFVDDATAFEYGIIEIDQDLMTDPEQVVQHVHREFISRSLCRSEPFLLKIGKGTPKFKVIED